MIFLCILRYISFYSQIRQIIIIDSLRWYVKLVCSFSPFGKIIIMRRQQKKKFKIKSCSNTRHKINLWITMTWSFNYMVEKKTVRKHTWMCIILLKNQFGLFILNKKKEAKKNPCISNYHMLALLGLFLLSFLLHVL